MKTFLPHHRLLGATVATVALGLAATPAGAALRTWYVAGNFDDANCGTPLEPRLASAYPSGTSFKGHFTFDDASSPLPVADGRTDFVTQPEQGGGVTLVTKKTTLSSTSSRMITQLSSDGAGNLYEQLTLNANTYTRGAELAKYGDAALDLVSLVEKATASPWFAYGMMPAAPPSLASANFGPSCVDIFYFDVKAQQYHHRFGNVTLLQDTPI